MQHLINYTKKLGFAALFLIPAITSADSIVPSNCAGAGANPCTYTDFLTLINNLIDFALYKLAAPLAVIAFAYAGFLYITAAGDSGKIGKAHEIFKKVIIGMILAFGAFLIVKAILSGLGVTNPDFNSLVN